MLKYRFLVLLIIIVPAPVRAQELGLLASILSENCQNYLEQMKLEKYSNNQKSFCFGYFESAFEHKQNLEGKNVFGCYPTYGDFDLFKIRVIEKFIEKADNHKDEYVRAFDLVRESIDEEFTLNCNKSKGITNENQ